MEIAFPDDARQRRVLVGIYHRFLDVDREAVLTALRDEAENSDVAIGCRRSLQDRAAVYGGTEIVEKLNLRRALVTGLAQCISYLPCAQKPAADLRRSDK